MQVELEVGKLTSYLWHQYCNTLLVLYNRVLQYYLSNRFISKLNSYLRELIFRSLWKSGSQRHSSLLGMFV